MRNIHSWRVARNTAGACTGTLGACSGTRLARRPELARVQAHGCTGTRARHLAPPVQGPWVGGRRRVPTHRGYFDALHTQPIVPGGAL